MPKSENRQRQCVVGFRVTSKELAQLKKLAAAQNMTVGTYIRTRALGK